MRVAIGIYTYFRGKVFRIFGQMMGSYFLYLGGLLCMGML